MALKTIKSYLKQDAVLFLKIENVGKIRDGSNIEYEEVGVAFKTRMSNHTSKKEHTNRNNKINASAMFYVGPEFIGNQDDMIMYKDMKFIIDEVVPRYDHVEDRIHH